MRRCRVVPLGNPCYSHTKLNDSRILDDQRRTLDVVDLGFALTGNSKLLGGR